MYRFANFTGSHNKSKVKVWLYLAEMSERSSGYFTINQIHNATGVPIFTLRKSLPIWWSWGRLSKKVMPTPLPDGSTCQYRITAFGRKYLDDIVPVFFYNECVEEILEYQAEKKAESRKRFEAYKARLRESGIINRFEKE